MGGKKGKEEGGSPGREAECRIIKPDNMPFPVEVNYVIKGRIFLRNTPATEMHPLLPGPLLPCYFHRLDFRSGNKRPGKLKKETISNDAIHAPPNHNHTYEPSSPGLQKEMLPVYGKTSFHNAVHHPLHPLLSAVGRCRLAHVAHCCGRSARGQYQPVGPPQSCSRQSRTV
jgi:hypothetical protein